MCTCTCTCNWSDRNDNGTKRHTLKLYHYAIYGAPRKESETKWPKDSLIHPSIHPSAVLPRMYACICVRCCLPLIFPLHPHTRTTRINPPECCFHSKLNPFHSTPLNRQTRHARMHACYTMPCHVMSCYAKSHSLLTTPCQNK